MFELLQGLNWAELCGVGALFILTFDRLAKLTPTEVDDKAAATLLTILYRIFAILGLKVPEIK